MKALAFAFIFLVQPALQRVSGNDDHLNIDASTQPKAEKIQKPQQNTQNAFTQKYSRPILTALGPCFNSLSYFPNAPWKPGLVLHGGPCVPIRSIRCEDFGCGSGIGFPVRNINCCCKGMTKKPMKRNKSAKRFDITSLPARPPSVTQEKHAENKPAKDISSHSKPNKVLKLSTKDPPKIDLELKLSDDLKASDFVVSHSNHHPHRHHRHHRRPRPWYSSSEPAQDRPRLPTKYLPIEVRLPNLNYWRFQGYYPHYMRVKASWAINPSDMKNIHNYPEYQYIDVPFTQSKHRRHRRPPFIDYNDLDKEEEEELQEALDDEASHMKNKIKSHHGYRHEEDRKMVENSEDMPEKKKQTSTKPPASQMPDDSSAKDETNGLNLHLKEDEQANYPEYATQFNTDRFWSNSPKQKVPVRRFAFRKPAPRKSSPVYKEFKPEYPGFDLENISKFDQKGKKKIAPKQAARKTHRVPSSEGIMVKSDSQNIANQIKSFV